MLKVQAGHMAGQLNNQPLENTMIGAVLVFFGAVALVATYITVVQFFLRAGEKCDDEKSGAEKQPGRARNEGSCNSCTGVSHGGAQPAGSH